MNEMGYFDTALVVTKFYVECFKFWQKEGKSDEEAATLALQDISNLRTNPYEPNGDLLNREAVRLAKSVVKDAVLGG